MTAQAHDKISYKGKDYALIGVKGSGLFTPEDFGLKVSPNCSACWRGYLLEYECRRKNLVLVNLHASLGRYIKTQPISGIQPLKGEGAFTMWFYRGIDMGVPFTGSLLMGQNFIQETYVHMGYAKAYQFRTVIELVFDGGIITCEQDLSDEVRQMRGKMPNEGAVSIDQFLNDPYLSIEDRFAKDYPLGI